MSTNPPEMEQPALNEKGEPQIEFVLIQDIELKESQGPIITKFPEGFLKHVLGKIREDPTHRHPVFLRIQGYTEKEIDNTMGYCAEMFFFDGPLIYRATYTITKEKMEDLAELFIANLESRELEGGSGKVFI